MTLGPGAIRAAIRAGAVTRTDLGAVLPFDNDLVIIELTGAQVWALLRQQFRVPQNRTLQRRGG